LSKDILPKDILPKAILSKDILPKDILPKDILPKGHFAECLTLSSAEPYEFLVKLRNITGGNKLRNC
jgi:hypothetical protein